ncbi:MAG: hypothetical protein M3R54_04350 [Chloroflexota bacterium]|nr:hypothetical protein [Chloroflexota bacterium]
MREGGDLRASLQTLGSAALGVGLGVAILGAGFVVSNLALAGSPTTAAAATSTPATAVPTSSAAQTQSPPTAAPTETPAPTATPVPTATPDPLTVASYQGQGLRLAALTMPAGYTLTSPIGGTVTVVLYQFVNGEIRSGANLQDRAFFPYVLVRSADREIKLRPGALDIDVQLIAKDGDTVAAGAPLFRIVAIGPSSWATFYDRQVTAQVIASVTTRPQGTEVDPVPVFRR